MNLVASLDFLAQLNKNNNREWFQANKALYQEAKAEFETYINILIPRLKEIDPDLDIFHARECVFRLFRDVRFAKDKSPFKTNFGAFMARGGRKSPYAGYYIHLQPGNSFIGGGSYMPQGAYLKAIRTEIYEHSETYKKIISKPAFKQVFPEIYGEKLKSAPRDFPKDWPDIDLIRNKHFTVTQAVDDAFWHSGDIHEKVLKVFKVQYPLNQFLNEALSRVNPRDR
ncbi:MAG: DUF2461 domain-containing protein [Candidatus Marinimicrobia bacterium]|nr:DUF2461 domain-containing protein [Candidatus Neomarinimicrobiota bacterium]